MTRLIFSVILEVTLDLAIGNLANYAEFALGHGRVDGVRGGSVAIECVV
jgi:hypothetical protein